MCGTSSSVRRVRPVPVHVQAAVVALVLCACLEVCLAAAAAQREGRIYSRSAGTYCGSRLSDALKFMCNGQYNSYYKAKKSAPAEEYWAPPVQLPFRERLRAAAFLDTRTRFARGVYDECCSKSCTLDELMSYCQARD